MPYVRAPEEIVPGKPLYFATARQRSSGREIDSLRGALGACASFP